MPQEQGTHGAHGTHAPSAKGYIIGFVLSIVLTIIPLVLVLNHMVSRVPLIAIIVVLAVVQLFVQLFYFMHIRDSEKPAYNVYVLALGLVVVFTIVVASMWIMTFNAQVQ